MASYTAIASANGAPLADMVEPSQGVTSHTARTVIPNDCGLYAAQSMLQALGVPSRVDDLRGALVY